MDRRILSTRRIEKLNYRVHQRKRKKHDNESNNPKFQWGFCCFNSFIISCGYGIENTRIHYRSDRKEWTDKNDLICYINNALSRSSIEWVIFIWSLNYSSWFASLEGIGNGYNLTWIIITITRRGSGTAISVNKGYRGNKGYRYEAKTKKRFHESFKRKRNLKQFEPLHRQVVQWLNQ